ncbi:MAG: type II secretion system F family protein [Candidatus Pacebacteria bacterium]|nr:type II secretion system F family protein [Candidatus Paceibacterota bacterium]
MKFRYTAADIRGKIAEGEIESGSTAEALAALSAKGLRPVSIRLARAGEGKAITFFGQSITIEDKVFLTKYLALMLRAGTDLFKAINILIQDLNRPALKAVLIEIKSNLEKGQPFYSTFMKYEKYFSPVFINLIKAGESSGNLESVLVNLSTALEKEQELKNKVRSALVYPIILLSISLVILILMVTFSLPKIAAVFTNSGFEIPTFSRIVFTIGLFLNAHGIVIMIGFVALVLSLWALISKVVIVRKVLFRLLTRVPALGSVLKEMALQRFASTLSLLMRSGLPILESLEITAGAVGNDDFRESLQRIAREGVAKGMTIGEAFRREPAFPSVISNLIAVSEKAGHTEDILKTISDFYESEIDSMVKSLVSFLEPVLLLFIGLIIGAIALAIIVPMYQLVGNI